VRTIILDNEAVQALTDPAHRKHRVVVAHLAGVVASRRRGAQATATVPTAVRVEAGWDRSAPTAAAINRFRVSDLILNSDTANLAAQIVATTGVSVADAHIGSAARRSPATEIVVLTSDPRDIVLAAAPKVVTAIRI